MIYFLQNKSTQQLEIEDLKVGYLIEEGDTGRFEIITRISKPLGLINAFSFQFNKEYEFKTLSEKCRIRKYNLQVLNYSSDELVKFCTMGSYYPLENKSNILFTKLGSLKIGDAFIYVHQVRDPSDCNIFIKINEKPFVHMKSDQVCYSFKTTTSQRLPDCLSADNLVIPIDLKFVLHDSE